MTRKAGNRAGFLQRPPEVFSAIMPPGRRLYAREIYLQRLNRSQAEELRQLYGANRAYLSRWLQPLPDRISLQTMQSLIAEDHLLARSGRRLDLGVFKSDSNQLIGRIALHSVDFGIQHSAGISYWMSHEFWRNGLMTRSLATLISFAFEEVCLHRLWLHIVSDNAASLGLACKLGFMREGILRKSLFVDGAWQDSVLMSMLADEYDAKADFWMTQGWLGNSEA
ncbi:MAG: GNAT family N-acetyltransferase [Candidatus Riflebacteria bacterium]|nr:GNAT family N-acetyltransferase [Candidatus Riflebacteria bacterium]